MANKNCLKIGVHSSLRGEHLLQEQWHSLYLGKRVFNVAKPHQPTMIPARSHRSTFWAHTERCAGAFHHSAAHLPSPLDRKGETPADRASRRWKPAGETEESRNEDSIVLNSHKSALRAGGPNRSGLRCTKLLSWEPEAG